MDVLLGEEHHRQAPGIHSYRVVLADCLYYQVSDNAQIGVTKLNIHILWMGVLGVVRIVCGAWVKDVVRPPELMLLELRRMKNSVTQSTNLEQSLWQTAACIRLRGRQIRNMHS